MKRTGLRHCLLWTLDGLLVARGGGRTTAISSVPGAHPSLHASHHREACKALSAVSLPVNKRLSNKTSASAGGCATASGQSPLGGLLQALTRPHRLGFKATSADLIRNVPQPVL